MLSRLIVKADTVRIHFIIKYGSRRGSVHVHALRYYNSLLKNCVLTAVVCFIAVDSTIICAAAVHPAVVCFIAVDSTIACLTIARTTVDCLVVVHSAVGLTIVRRVS